MYTNSKEISSIQDFNSKSQTEQVSSIECIEFNSLRSVFDMYETEIFDMYVEEIFHDLSSKDSLNTKFIGKSRFINYIHKVPIFIAEKLYVSFCSKKDVPKLEFEYFLTPLKIFRYGSYEACAKVIFDIFDFDKDGIINSKDIQLLLSYLPLKAENKKREYKYQLESLRELRDLVLQTFEDSTNQINFEDYLKAMEKKPDIFLHLFCFLYLNIPIFEKNLLIYKKKLRERRGSLASVKSSDSNNSISISTKSTKSVMSSPGKKFKFSPSCFSPITNLKSKIKSNFSPKPSRKISLSGNDMKDIIIGERIDILGGAANPKSLSNISILIDQVLNTKTSDLKQMSTDSTSFGNEEIKSSLKKESLAETNVEEFNVDYNSKFGKEEHHCSISMNETLGLTKDHSSILKKLKDCSHLSKTKILECSEENEEANNTDSDEDDDVDILVQNSVKFEGELFTFSKEKDNKNAEIVKAKRFYLSIIDTSIYYYTNKDVPKENYFKNHYIDGCFIKENKAEMYGGKEFFSFTIKFPDMKKRQYFNQDKSLIKQWIKFLREATGYRNFFDFYRLDKTIGEGQFGLVKVGYKITDNKKVAVKILEKDNIKTKDDWELIKTEIDILKISKHPNVIKFLDHFENSDYIFIVMEYLNSGNLQEYITKNSFNLNETEVAIVAYQMADALKYLHNLGIIHRDFKPENIMLRQSSKDNKIELKLMDFGLSKILGSKEKTLEGYGTMAFVAPEVIAKKPYNSSVDIWSLGVTIYYMLSGEIPFLAKNKSESTADLILTKELLFSQKFKNYSQEVVDLLTKCLIKNSSQRANIEQVMEHKWFKMHIYHNTSFK